MDGLKPFDSRCIDNNDEFNPAESLYIEASAGTGKTYTIQQIVSRLILDGTPLSRILIVTYTDKAAGELKDRISQKIEEVLETGKLIKDGNRQLDPQEMARFKAALDERDSVQIFTIHSFCQKTLNTMAYDAWRPFEMQLVDDKLVKNLIDRWVRDEWPTLREYESLLVADDENESTQDKNIDRFIDNLETLFVNAISKFYLKADGTVDDHIISTALTKADPLTDDEKRLSSAQNCDDLRKIPEFQSILESLEARRGDPWNPKSKSNATIADLLESIYRYQKGKKLYNGIQYRKFQGIGEDQSHLMAFKDKLDDALKKEKTYQAYAYHQFLCEQLSKLYCAWRDEKLENKQESYQDMIVAVHHAVKDEKCPLRDKIREAYQYAIIDEFQDTNQLQWDIFKTVFLQDHDTDKNRVPDHSIFVVGDPKQSIYSFQAADLDVYHKAIHEIGNGRRLDANFRSTRPMIEACNRLFQGDYFDGNGKTGDESSGNKIEFQDAEYPKYHDGKGKLNATWDGEETKAVWLCISDTPDGWIGERDFAKCVAQKIVECCELVEGRETTRLQVFEKHSNGSCTLRNVRFSDFAVLAKSRSEFVHIENELKRLGIPFLRYKDNNLFTGRECLEWIAIFQAIDADDFSSDHRHYLNEALLTDFFEIPTDAQHGKIKVVGSVDYDNPSCPERLMIARWHSIARQYRWAELLESIYRESQVEERLSSLSKLQEMARLHQIGYYCIEYLYQNRCAIEDLIRHLNDLQNHESVNDDADGNLVAKGTDFDAVQLMTIHASKGLEFPVVIAVAGFKGYNPNSQGPFLFHDKSMNLLKLGFDKEAKERRKEEELNEWRRLFYVAYTRATSLLILPKYKKWCPKDNKGKDDDKGKTDNKGKDDDKSKTSDFEFLGKSVERLEDHCLGSHFNAESHVDSTRVSAILARQNEGNRDPQTCSSASRDKQVKKIQNFQSSIATYCLKQHSYSSLAPKRRSFDGDDAEEVDCIDEHGNNANRFGDQNERGEQKDASESNIDKNPVSILKSEDYCEGKFHPLPTNYPVGVQLGNAVHEILEKADFALASQMTPSENFKELIQTSFMRYGLTHAHREAEKSSTSDWIQPTAEMIYHTLNARLPEILGHERSGKPLYLKALNAESHFAEVEFMLSETLRSSENIAQHFSKGYMDLLFLHPDDQGHDRYSILDWKTDRLEDAEYHCPEALKKKVDSEYDIQRVLYAYCLIQWLSRFPKFKDKTVDDIFENHFGGIYYVFVRGTYEGTSNGIYAQTWDCFESLKRSYDEIEKLMRGGKS